ncbi:hypothetical protein WME94_14390 [Sorangium sp. So ce429]
MSADVAGSEVTTERERQIILVTGATGNVGGAVLEQPNPGPDR